MKGSKGSKEETRALFLSLMTLTDDVPMTVFAAVIVLKRDLSLSHYAPFSTEVPLGDASTVSTMRAVRIRCRVNMEFTTVTQHGICDRNLGRFP